MFNLYNQFHHNLGMEIKSILVSMILILTGIVLLSQYTAELEILRTIGAVIAVFGGLILALSVKKEITA